jgi:hypothetical protein
VIGIRVGLTPHHTTEQLEDVTYYVEASTADGKNVSVCKLLAQALTGNSGKVDQGTSGSGQDVDQKPKAGDATSEKEGETTDSNDLPKDQ